MIGAYQGVIQKEFVKFLTDDRQEGRTEGGEGRRIRSIIIFCGIEMRLAYNLLILVTDGIKPLLDSLEKHIIRLGKEKVINLGSLVAKDPQPYIDCLYALYKKYFAIVMDCFRQDASFEASLDKVCKPRSSHIVSYNIWYHRRFEQL